MSLSPLKSAHPSFGKKRNSPIVPLLGIAAAAGLLYFGIRLFLGNGNDLKEGYKAWKLRQWDAAEAHFQAALTKDPSSAPAKDGLGLVAAGKGDYESAARDFQAAMALGLKKNRAFPHEEIGKTYLHQGNYPAALTEFRHALQLTPDSWPSHLGLAQSLEATGGLADAASEYHKVLASRPAMAGPQKGLERISQARARGGVSYLLDRRGETLARQIFYPDGRTAKAYPLGQFAAHVVGVDSIKMGKTGLEQDLRSLFPGNTVTLTLDARIQRAADAAMGWKKGALVVMDPATGEILAAVNHPSFNPNKIESEYATYKWKATKPLKDRALGGLYEPGSIVKVVTAAAALESQVDLKSIFPVESNQPLKLDGKLFWDWRKLGRVESLARALDLSSNIAMAKVAFAMGADRLFDYDGRFGFGVPEDLSLDLPGFGKIEPQAATSQAPLMDPSQFALAERACGLGKDFRITPLHACELAAAVANRGMMMKPSLVKEIRNVEGELIYQNKPTPLRKACEPETAAKLKDYMLEATEQGIGRKASVTGLHVAGKTGTARTGAKGLDAWYIGFAPADQPKIAIAVLGDSEGTGMDVAAPIAGNLIRSILK
jgi:peptidoglycan glycosyltransferase